MLNKIDDNEWFGFSDNIRPLQIKSQDKNTAIIRNCFDDKTSTITLFGNSTFDGFHKGLQTIDVCSWDYAVCDFADIKKFMFSKDPEEKQNFLEINNCEGRRFKVIFDLFLYLKSNNLRLTKLLWVIAGRKYSFDTLNQCWEYLENYKEFDSWIMPLESDCEMEHHYLFFACKPGKMEFNDALDELNPYKSTNSVDSNKVNSRKKEIEPDFEGEDDPLERGFICEEHCNYVAAMKYFKKALKTERKAEAYYHIGRLIYDGLGTEEDSARGCHYFELAYKNGYDDFRTGDLIMLGSYHQYDVAAEKKHGLLRDMDRALMWYWKLIDKDIEIIEAIKNDPNDGRSLDFWKKELKLDYGRIGMSYLEEEIKDYKKAYKYLKKSGCVDDRLRFYMARMYERGYYVHQNFEKASEYYNLIINDSLDSDDFYVQLAILELRKINGIPEGKEDEFVTREEKIDVLIEKGYILRDEGDYIRYKDVLLEVYNLSKMYYANYTASMNLAKMYRRGQCGLSVDYDKAFSLYNIQAKMGDSEAQLCVVDMYNSGNYTKKPGLARKYLKELELANYKPAYPYLSGEYRVGRNLLKKNLKKSIDFCERMAMDGDKMGFEFLGELYYLGEEITRDYDKAFLYYLFAKGDFNAPESYFYMAYMYDKGYGTCKNSKLAMTYYKKGIERWEYFFGNLPPKKLDEYNVDKDKYLKAKRRLKNLEKKLI